MNTHVTPPTMEAPAGWKKPDMGLFLHNRVTRFAALWRRRPIVVSIAILIALLIVYTYRYLWEPYVLLMPRIYLLAIVMAGGLAVLGWKAIGWILPAFLARFLKPIGALLGVLILFGTAAVGDNFHTFLSQYWRYQTLNIVEPKVDPVTDNERVWSLDGIQTFVRRQMRDTETPTKPHLVREGNEYYWTMGVEPTTWLLQYLDPVEEVIRIRSDITSFDFIRGRNARFATGEKLLFSRNIYTCVQRRFWFWNAATHEVSRTTMYLKNTAGKSVQVVPIIRWTGWVFPRPEFGGVMVLEEQAERGWLGERLETLKRVFWGCGTWIGPDQIATHPYLVGQNLVPFEVTRYMASSLRFRNGFWAPTWLRREGDIRIADMPDDQNEQPFTLYFHIRDDEGKVVVSKLFQYVALEPYDSAHQGHAAELLHPADGIGPSYMFQFFGERESLTGVTAVPGWVRSSRRNYDWSTNLPNEHRPFIKDMPDSNGVVKPRRMWLTAVVTIDKKKYDSKDPKGFITGSPEIVITDARRNRPVWVDSDHPHKWPEQLAKELGPYWAEK